MAAETSAHSGEVGAVVIRENALRDPFLLLKCDHDRFRELLTELRDLPKEAVGRRGIIASELVREISSHASIEEQHVHALYKQHLGSEGKKYFDDSLVADQRMQLSLRTLDTNGGMERTQVMPVSVQVSASLTLFDT